MTGGVESRRYIIMQFWRQQCRQNISIRPIAVFKAHLVRNDTHFLTTHKLRDHGPPGLGLDWAYAGLEEEGLAALGSESGIWIRHDGGEAFEREYVCCLGQRLPDSCDVLIVPHRCCCQVEGLGEGGFVEDSAGPQCGRSQETHCSFLLRLW